MTNPRTLRPLPAKQIASLLGLGPDAIHDLRRRGELVPLGQFGGAEHPEYRYCPEAVNRLLARSSHGFKTPPTIEALMRREICLISSSEASEMIGRSIERVNKYATLGYLASVQLYEGRKGSLRKFCKKSIEEYLEDKQRQLFTLTQATKVLGAGSYHTVDELVKRGELQDVYPDARDGRNRRFITPDSLCRVVQARMVPNDGMAEVWIEDCLDDERKLFTSSDVMRELGLGRKPALRLADSGRLRHIVRSRVRLFLPMSVDAYREQQAQFNFDEIARLLRTSSQTIRNWHVKGLLENELQHTCEDGWCRGCVVALLQRWLTSDNILPTELFERMISGTCKLQTAPEVQVQLGCSNYTVRQQIREGNLIALALPLKGWRIITFS